MHQRSTDSNVATAAAGDSAVLAKISSRTFERLSAFITQELGIKMPSSKTSLIQSRLLRRLRELDMQSIDEYCEYLFASPPGSDERVHFIDAITTNKTDFFREAGHFDYLTRVALPQIERWNTEPNGKTYVWSAACSSGEEPYTLAMVLSEYAATRPRFQFQLLATDISTKVLHKAKEGIYTEEQVVPVPAPLRRKFLLKGKGQQASLVRVTPQLRQLVSFHRVNFMHEDYGVRNMFHVIFCRNVLIYFDRPTQEAVIGKLCRNLHPGGFLFVSHSESLSGLNLPLVALGSSCFKKAG